MTKYEKFLALNRASVLLNRAKRKVMVEDGPTDGYYILDHAWSHITQQAQEAYRHVWYEDLARIRNAR